MRPTREFAQTGPRGNAGQPGRRLSTVVGQPTCRRALLTILVVCCTAGVAGGQGRRVVDVVKVGDSIAEASHGYAGESVSEGLIDDGRRFRQALGWQRYTLAVYDDSEVALSLTFRGSEGRQAAFDLVVEGRQVATHTFTSPSAVPATVEIRLPVGVTSGKTSLMVMLRAVDGPTPGLIELRAVQEHLEHPLRASPPAPSTVQGTTPGPCRSHILVDSPAPITVILWPLCASPSRYMGDLV
jgi:hypothetical protein